MPDGLLDIRFIFSCKQCGKALPIEDYKTTAFSVEHAQILLRAFADTVEPRTIKCSCAHEAKYHQQDLQFVFSK